jgi:hypothetical protein
LGFYDFGGTEIGFEASERLGSNDQLIGGYYSFN